MYNNGVRETNLITVWEGTMANLAGKTLGNYEIIERVGRGGMAEVYKGYHPKLDRHVAIKVLHGFLAEGEDFLARFEREAKAVASLRHENIVQIHDFDVQDDNYYMVMEFVDGDTLTDKLKKLSKTKSKMPLDEVLSVIKQVAKALAYAHKRKIIHRDLKPSNILIDKDGQTFLTDFGIAKIASTTQFTSTGALIGTPAYMSPEQCKGTELTHVSDLYSLGIILYEMLTGDVPFESETPLSVLQKHITEPVPSLYEHRLDLPSSFEKIISTALAKEPEDRFQTATEISKALAQAIDEAEIVEEPTKEEKAPVDTTMKPTVVMEEDEITDATIEPTVVMEEESETQPEPVKEEPPLKVEKTPEPAKRKEEKPVKKREAEAVSLKDRLPLKIIIPGAIAIVGLVLVFAFGGFGGVEGGGEVDGGCASIEECQGMANDLWDRGQHEDAIMTLDHAIEMVPENEHQPFAHLWCQRAEYVRILGWDDQIGFSEEMCGAWERGE
jgi:serine/threonine protein kinase